MPARRSSGRMRNSRVKVEITEPNTNINGGVIELAFDDADTMQAILSSLALSNSKDDAIMVGLSTMGPQAARVDPYTEVTEQPKPRDHRFRYPVEGRQAGSIAGQRSTSDIPSFPSVKVHNLSGRAKVVVSLVTKDDPPRPHPHRLVGDNCKDGVCTMLIDHLLPEAVFRKIGVQRTMNKEVENSLAERKKAGVQLSMEVNKGKTGKKHNYDMKSVKLYFEVLLETRESSGVFDRHLAPVTSTLVYDKKDTVLTICRISINHGTVAGGDEIFILCEKVQAEDIKVKFHGVDPATNKEWDAFGIFGPSDVHRQFAIVCKTPPFVNQNITAPVQVKFHLYRSSDVESSNDVDFTFKPRDNTSGQREIENKKRKLSHKDPGFDKYFTAGGQPFKTETLGASAQSCSGAPISNPVSSALETLTLNPVTTPLHDSSSSRVKQSLRQTLIRRGDQSLGSRPSTPSTIPFHSGTAQPVDPSLHVTMTSYSSEAHMSSGRLIHQQPVSTDRGHYDIPAQAMLLSLATNQEMSIENDSEKQTSEQRINDIVNDLMSVEGEGAVGGILNVVKNERVVVQEEPSSYFMDIQYSSLDTIDVGALQEVTSLSGQSYDLVFSQADDPEMTMNNVSSNAT